MAEQVYTDASALCPTFDALPEKDQKMILDAFNLAVGLAERTGLPEVELFQLLEDVIDGHAINRARAEMEQDGGKPKTLETLKEELGV